MLILGMKSNSTSGHFIFPKSAINQIWSIRQKFGLQKVVVAAVFLFLRVVSKFNFGTFWKTNWPEVNSQNRQLKSNNSMSVISTFFISPMHFQVQVEQCVGFSCQNYSYF